MTGRHFARCVIEWQGEVTFLLDTYSTQRSGLPVAISVMKETPERVFSVRFDSESTMEEDYHLGVQAFREAEIEAPINLGGGFNAVKTRRFETLRAELGWPSQPPALHVWPVPGRTPRAPANPGRCGGGL